MMGKEKNDTFCSSSKCQVLMLFVVAGSIAVVLCVALLSQAVRTRREPPPNLKWWQTSIVYQIYPKSFKDSNGDGTGDIRGIINKLEYFEYLNVGAVWVSPIYKSPMKDNGYDISDFTDVDPLFGNITDMAELIDKCHKKGIKVILDFIPNHTSDQHPWFLKSAQNDPKFRDFYVWSDQSIGTNQGAPNNWLSVFSNSAWEWHPKRKQFFYHAFLKEQPDLNYRNPAVVQEMKNVLQFWLGHGVDGFRIDAMPHLFEVTNLTLNEPRSNRTDKQPSEWDYLQHVHTYNQFDEISQVLDGWREVLNVFEKKDNVSRLLLVESYTRDTTERNWWYNSAVDMAFYFYLVSDINPNSGGRDISQIVDGGYEDLPDEAWPNFVLGNHDSRRIATRKGSLYVDALNMMLLTLRGTPTTYYGEEIGMRDSIPQDLTGKADKNNLLTNSRDPERSPMQWSNTVQAGFSNNANTWLPVGDYHNINVESEKTSKDYSSLQLYKDLADIRKHNSLKYGNIQKAVVNDNIFSYVRSTAGYPSYLVILNFGNATSTDDYTSKPVESKHGHVVVHTRESKTNLDLSLDKVTLEPGEGLLIRLK